VQDLWPLERRLLGTPPGEIQVRDWDAQAVRLLIEAVCDLARVPLPIACNDRASE
jgi:hypothetical protein